MASFEARYGFAPARTIIQTDTLDDDTRVRLWNVIARIRKQLNDNLRYDEEDQVLGYLWSEHFKRPLDVMPNSDAAVWNAMRDIALKGEWFKVFALIEDFIDSTELIDSTLPTVMATIFDEELETCLVGWRFVGAQLVRVDRDEERQALVDALADSSEMAGANDHLNRAITHLSNRERPDYANAVKEAISAVEAVVRKLTGESTLGAGLKKLASSGVTIHPALQGAWEKLYGWPSDAKGVRHGSIDPSTIDQTLAKYMVVSCSGFVSYLFGEGRKQGLLE